MKRDSKNLLAKGWVVFSLLAVGSAQASVVNSVVKSKSVSSYNRQLERIKEEIRAKHGDLSVNNANLTIFRSDNTLFVKIGNGLDQIKIDLGTYTLENAKDFTMPVTATVSIMGFRDFVSELTESIYDQARTEVTADQLNSTTSLRASAIIDGLAAAAKAPIANPDTATERTPAATAK